MVDEDPNWERYDEDKAVEEMPEELVEEVQQSVRSLAVFALYMEQAQEADIWNAPLVQDMVFDVAEINPEYDGQIGFRVTVQAVPEEDLGGME